MIERLQVERREKCYKCYRPKSSCMCQHIRHVETKTKFVILMHPKEYRKIKNGTGHLTHLSLPNSELYVGIDFSLDGRINELLQETKNLCYLLFPSKDSIEINSHQLSLEGKNVVILGLVRKRCFEKVQISPLYKASVLPIQKPQNLLSKNNRLNIVSQLSSPPFAYLN